MSVERINQVCYNCGVEKLHRAPGFCTWRLGVCDICGKEKDVTEPTRFNGLLTIRSREYMSAEYGDARVTLWTDPAYINNGG
jgi:hypothetical protein